MDLNGRSKIEFENLCWSMSSLNSLNWAHDSCDD